MWPNEHLRVCANILDLIATKNIVFPLAARSNLGTVVSYFYDKLLYTSIAVIAPLHTLIASHSHFR